MAAILFILMLLWIGYTIQNVPSDLAIIRDQFQNEDLDEFWTSITVAGFCWITSAYLAAFHLIPDVYAVVKGFIGLFHS